MTNDIKIRLSALIEMLGGDMSENSADRAETEAYVRGIECVLNSFDQSAKEIDINKASSVGLSLYCEMTGVDSTLEEEEKRKQVTERLSQVYGDYKLNDIYYALADISPELTVGTSRFKMIFNLCRFEKDFDLKKLSKVINEMVPPCTVVGFLGDGATFDRWDATSFLFQDYDNIDLPFDLLEQMT